MYTMMQVCRELDMTYQTLKFYCNEAEQKTPDCMPAAPHLQ